MQRRDALEEKYSTWQGRADRLTAWVAAVRNWRGRKLPYTAGVIDVWMLLCLLDYCGAGEHINAREVVRWAAGTELPLQVTGTGLLDCHLYEQPGRVILHMVNLTSEATWRAPLDELIRVGPFDVTVRWPAIRAHGSARREVWESSDKPQRLRPHLARSCSSHRLRE